MKHIQIIHTMAFKFKSYYSVSVIPHISLTIVFILFSINGMSQSNVENVLAEIKQNNKTLMAITQYWNAEKLQFRTGLTPYNPTIEYDYLTGNSSNANIQSELNITQTFDFPTAYFKKNQLANQQITQSDFKLTSFRQDILLAAKQVCLKLIYHNKLQFRLAHQKKILEELLSVYKTKMEKGDANILEVNKVQLQLIEIKKEFQANLSEVKQLNQKIIELNGGRSISFNDTIYPVTPALPPFEQLENDYESNDPLLKNLEQGKIIAQKQIEVSRALSFPKMELGYHYQGISGQNYSGIHTGISIPLWEKRNTVKQKKAQFLFADLELQAHINEHYYHIKHIYEKYSNLKIILEEYQSVYLTFNNFKLLNKALSLGEINTIQYFTEVNYYNSSFNNYLQTEMEYYQTIAELYKYQL